jgi:hypothetical protein
MQVTSYNAAALGSFSKPIRIAYPVPAVRKAFAVSARYMKEHWIKITLAVLGGLIAGFFAGAASSREYTALNQVVYAANLPPAQSSPAVSPAPSPSAANQAVAQEISRLRAENQQLQSLVEQLRKGSPATHSRRAKARHRRHASSHVSG